MTVPIAIWAFFFISFPTNATSQYQNSFQKNLDKINEMKLWESRDWKRLLHDENYFWGDTSEADSENFFLSPEGRSNYRDELIELLKQASDLSDIQKKHVVCRFPARIKWLYKKLNQSLDEAIFLKCQEYQDYLKMVESDSASLVFSSYYLSSPASAFGHTLLRLSRKKTSIYQDTKLLDIGVNYSAQVTTDNAFLYAMFGLVGVFKGTYSAIPYYYKVREYNDYEFRDLWSYDLNLSPEEHQRLLDHLWEIGNTYFFYYYFTENCSYNLLTLLEVARFDLDLRKSIPWYATIPSATLHAVSDEPGFVKKVYARPSMRKKFEYNYNLLNKAQRDLVLAAYNSRNISDIQTANITEEDRAKAIDVLIYYVDFLHPQEVLLDKGEISKWKGEILAYRSTLGPSQMVEENIVDPKEAPHLGHYSRRVGLGMQQYEGQSFTSLQYRFALHELMDPILGQPKYATLEFGDLSIIHRDNKTYLQKFDLIEVMALNPVTEFQTPISLKAKFGWINEASLCDYCTAFSARVGGGLAFELPQGTVFGFIDAKTMHSEHLNDYNLLLLIPNVHYKLQWSDQQAILFTAEYEYLTNYQWNRMNYAVGYNYYPTNNFRIELGINANHDNNDMKLNLYFYY